MKNNEIQQALNTALSSLHVSDTEAGMLLAQAKGGKKVKKKLSVAMVLLLALIAISVTALAVVSLQQYYEKTVEKEGQLGLIEGWKANDHIAFVNLMTEAGIKLNEDKLVQMRDITLSEEARGKIAWELIQEYYPARDGILTSVDIIAKEKGPVEKWSLEEKAWFSQIMQKYRSEETLYGINLMPEAGDISQQEAENIFYNYYEAAYGLGKDTFETDTLTSFFGEQTFDDGSGSKKKRCWVLNVNLKNEIAEARNIDGTDIGAYISSDGVILSASQIGEEPSWKTASDRLIQSPRFFRIDSLAQFDQNWRPKMEALMAEGQTVADSDLYFVLHNKHYAMPTQQDINRDTAYTNAAAAVAGLKLFETEQVTRCYPKTHEAYLRENSEQFVYRFAFIRTDQEHAAQSQIDVSKLPAMITVDIDPISGAVLQVCPSGIHYERWTDRYGI